MPAFLTPELNGPKVFFLLQHFDNCSPGNSPFAAVSASDRCFKLKSSAPRCWELPVFVFVFVFEFAFAFVFVFVFVLVFVFVFVFLLSTLFQCNIFA